MRRQLRGLNQIEKEFAQGFDSLARHGNPWEVWQNFVTLSAISLASVIDTGYKATRENEYMKIAGRYTQKELLIFSELFHLVVEALEVNPDQDFLGRLYMLMELGNKAKAQYFTPYSVCRLMADMVLSFEGIEERGYITINDPCCGAGATLIAAMNTAKRAGIFFHDHILFVGQDIDYTVAMMCYIQLSLLGCPGYVIVGNSLTEPHTVPLHDHGNVWYTPFYFKDVWHWRRVFQMLDAMTKRPEPAITLPISGRPYYYYYSEGGEG